MKTKLIALALLGLTLVAQAANLTPGVNPPPSVQLGWTPSPDTNVDGYILYSGPSSHNYTNAIILPAGTTNYTATGLTRGVACFFVVTATAAGLESDPSNEISYTPRNKPAPPGQMKPPVTLVVQSKSMTDPNALWVDQETIQVPTGDGSGIALRVKLGPALTLIEAPQLASPQVRALRALNAVPQPPAPK